MKLHEIEWVDGKEYTMEILGVTKNVKVEEGELYDSKTEVNVANLFSVLGLLKANFTEVVKAVTFLEAYQDCLVNGQEYISDTGRFKLTNAYGKHVRIICLHDMSAMNKICIDETKWTKVVK